MKTIICLLCAFLFSLEIVTTSIELKGTDVTDNNVDTALIIPQIVAILLHSFQPNSSHLSIESIKSIKYEIHINGENFEIDLHQHSGGEITRQMQCHFSGSVNKDQNSGANFNLCEGMAGIFYLNHREYIIKPTAIAKSRPGFSAPWSRLLPHYISNRTVVSKSTFFCKILERSIERRKDIPDEADNRFKVPSRSKRSLGSDEEEEEPQFPSIHHDVIHNNIVELLIVVTSNLVKKFGKDLNEYILNNVAIASKMLRDPTIKTSISLSVVDIIALDKDYERLNNLNNWNLLTQDAVVDRFCHWIQYKKKYSKYVWDSAILINDGSFSTYAIGITHLRSMCANNNCIAVVDRGFGTGFIIAHELGHQMNAPHDFDSVAACKRFEQKEDQGYNTIMSTSLYFEHFPFKWSRCSEHLINEFLRSDDSWCLKQHNKGQVLYLHSYIYEHHKNFSTGLRYDLSTQCTLAFGEPAEQCNSIEHIKTCKSLYCNPRRVGLCMRSHSIVGDGTPCDTDKRCIHGKCIHVDAKVVPIDGDWSAYSDWSNCSRLCNGGIQFSERLCNNPTPTLGGRYCIGTRVLIRSCNIHPCEKEMDIREQICKRYNARPYIPRVDEESLCKLICIKDNRPVIHGYELVDGTPCYAHKTDICVRSKCYKTGCDRVISSDKVYDNCHVCGGRNNTCSRVDKFFDGSTVPPSRIIVAFKLPMNITNVYLRKVSERYRPFTDEVYDDYQILLIINRNTIIRRGESTEQFSSGELYYSGSNKREEIYRITGLIDKEIVVLIRTENHLTRLPIPSVEYHYYVPKEQSRSMKEMYSWSFPKFNISTCLGLCNDKIRINPLCTRNKDKVQVQDMLCQHYIKPLVKLKDCKSLCGYKWQKPSKETIQLSTNDFCSVRCGTGHRIVSFQCQKRSTVKGAVVAWQAVGADHCFTAGLVDRPYEVVPCTGACYSLVWAYDDWSNCSDGCGSGSRYRISTCKDIKGRKWNSEQCLKEIGGPEEKESCITVSTCKEETVWVSGSWSPCSKSCGSGLQTRDIACLRKNEFVGSDDMLNEQLLSKTEKISRSFCLSYSDAPATTRSCMLTRCYVWTMDEGSKCSVTCGVGTKVYDYLCSRFADSQIVVDHRYCFENGLDRPAPTTKSCDMGPCYKAKWLKLPWGMCSETCGKGMRLRSIRCGYTTLANETILFRNDAHCRNESRPSVMEYCQVTPCSAWRYGVWSQCEGKCLYGVQHRSVDCVDTQTGKLLPNSTCPKSANPKIRKCLLDSLCGYWKVGEWSKCSVTCGLGTKTRNVECHHINGTRSQDTSICRNPLPFDEIHCENPVCKSRSFWWLLKSSECYSYGCDPGVLYSDIRCVNEEFEILEDDMCNEFKHPNYYVGCVKTECRRFFWKAMSWLDIPCSGNSCMMAIRNRIVNCVDDYGNVYGNGHCDEVTKLDDWRLCPSARNCSDVPRSCKELKKRHPESEDGEYSLAIDLNWTYFIYCADMKSKDPIEYLTLKRPNYSRSSKYLSIPANGTCTSREEDDGDFNCPGCAVDEALRSITYYNKIRVNMSDLSIDIFDTRYSTTMGTSFIPYGTARDCAGSASCPQGHFMIDLSGTEFSVSMKTVWNEIYNNYGYRIVRTKGSQIVKGWCGGKCSGCAPLPKLYIEPQMYGRDLEVKSHI